MSKHFRGEGDPTIFTFSFTWKFGKRYFFPGAISLGRLEVPPQIVLILPKTYDSFSLPYRPSGDGDPLVQTDTTGTTCYFLKCYFDYIIYFSDMTDYDRAQLREDFSWACLVSFVMIMLLATILYFCCRDNISGKNKIMKKTLVAMGKDKDVILPV